MKNKLKIIILLFSSSVFLLIVLYSYFFVYGFEISANSLYIEKVKLTDGVFTITGNDIRDSALAFSGYSANLNGEQLIIKPRFSLVSRFNRYGNFTITYDAKGKSIKKIIIIGKKDKKDVWSQTYTEQRENRNILSKKIAFASINEWLKTSKDIMVIIKIGTYTPSKPEKELLAKLKLLGYINCKLDAKGNFIVNLTPKGQSVFFISSNVKVENYSNKADIAKIKLLKVNKIKIFDKEMQAEADTTFLIIPTSSISNAFSLAKDANSLIPDIKGTQINKPFNKVIMLRKYNGSWIVNDYWRR